MNINNNPFAMSYWVVPLTRKTKLTYRQNEAIANEIIEKVCSYYNISNTEIRGRSRFRECVLPRHMAMYIIRNKLPLKLKAIAELFGRDHTTAIHGIKNISNEVRYNEDVRQDLENLINIL